MGHVLWQWHAPDLWRRFTIRLGRTLAREFGVPAKTFRKLARVSYTKVVEFQARGLIHVHAIMRLYSHLWPGDEDRIRDAVDLALGPATEDRLRTAGEQS